MPDHPVVSREEWLNKARLALLHREKAFIREREDLASGRRDEPDLPWPMAWISRHDQYE